MCGIVFVQVEDNGFDDHVCGLLGFVCGKAKTLLVDVACSNVPDWELEQGYFFRSREEELYLEAAMPSSPTIFCQTRGIPHLTRHPVVPPRMKGRLSSSRERGTHQMPRSGEKMTMSNNKQLRWALREQVRCVITRCTYQWWWCARSRTGTYGSHIKQGRGSSEIPAAPAAVQGLPQPGLPLHITRFMRDVWLHKCDTIKSHDRTLMGHKRINSISHRTSKWPWQRRNN